MAGQINRHTKFGELIFTLAKDLNLKTFLEIGTWNGQGSTKCFLDALLPRGDDWLFYSLESNEKLHDSAKSFWLDLIPDNARLMRGRIVEPTDLLSIEELKSSADFKPEHERWYECDILDYGQCENVEALLPDFFDAVLLDGGEFSTYAEFNKIKDRTSTLLLDDTNTLKCSKIVGEIKDSGDWLCIVHETEERNGFAAFERRLP